MNQFFIFLQTDGAVRWLYRQPDGGRILMRGEAASFYEWDQLPSVTLQSELVLVLPTEWVLLQPVALPRGAKREALPLLLEGQLFVDIEQQYWADCTGRGSERLVAMVALELWHRLQDQLDALDLTPTAIVADSWLLPRRDDAVTLLELPERRLALAPNSQGWAVPAALENALLQTFADSPVKRFSTEAVAGSAESVPDDLDGWLSGHWQRQPCLLHGARRKRSTSTSADRGALKKRIAAAVALLALLWGGLEYTDRQQQEAQRDAEIAQLLAPWPQLQPGADLRQQVIDLQLAQQQDRALRQQLTPVAALLRGLAGYGVTGLRYETGGLVLETRPLTAARQDQLVKQVSKQGWQLSWLEAGRKARLREADHAG